MVGRTLLSCTLLACGWVAIAARSPQVAVPAVSQAPASAPSPGIAPDLGSVVRLPANLPIDIEIVDSLSSKTSKIGDVFALRLADPIVVEGRTIAEAGTIGEGQVVHAKRAGMAGRAGELIITARYIDCGGIHLPLRGFHFGLSGHQHDETAFATSIVIPFAGFLVSGGQATVPAGTRANARLSADVDLPAAGLPCRAATTA